MIAAKLRTLTWRATVSMLRLPGRVVPISGWFPLVVEPIHRHLMRESGTIETEMSGVSMRLDLRDYTQRRIFYGAHEPREALLVRRLLRPGDVALDVGAHVGFFTLVFAAAVGAEGRVHAFEPAPDNFRALASNVGLNGFANVELNRAAAGASAGMAEFGLAPTGEANTGGYTQGGSDRRFSARVVALDDYVRIASVTRPSVS